MPVSGLLILLRLMRWWCLCSACSWTAAVCAISSPSTPFVSLSLVRYLLLEGVLSLGLCLLLRHLDLQAPCRLGYGARCIHRDAQLLAVPLCPVPSTTKRELAKAQSLFGRRREPISNVKTNQEVLKVYPKLRAKTRVLLLVVLVNSAACRDGTFLAAGGGVMRGQVLHRSELRYASLPPTEYLRCDITTACWGT